MNRKIAEQIRDPECTKCKLSNGAVDVCITASGPKKAKVLVVGKVPNSGRYTAALNNDLQIAGFDLSEVAFTAALKCRNFDLNEGTLDRKSCKPYLDQEIALIKPDWIITMGNEALASVTGHSGIMKWRGKIFPHESGAQVFATISPASVMRNPGQRQGYEADLLFISGKMRGRAGGLKMPPVTLVSNEKKIEQLKKDLSKAKLLSYDVETKGIDEFSKDGGIVSLSGTMVMPDGEVKVWALPLWHPQSMFFNNWQAILHDLAPYLIQPKKLVAHNGKFDQRWLWSRGVEIGLTFDTMLACHLIDENRQKGLKPQAMSRLGVAPWAIDTKDLWNTPLRKVLLYNAKDTFYTYHIYLQLREELIEKPRLLRIFQLITIPASNHLRKTEQYGIWIDREKLTTNTKIANDMRDGIEDRLMEWVPISVDSDHKKKGCKLCKKGHHTKEWPTLGVKKTKPAEINFNPSNFSRWWLFQHIGLPVIERGKDKDDGSPGAPSMKEAVMMELRPHHPVVPLMLQRSEWEKKISSFLGSYDEQMDENDRVHTTFKVTGTVTGRLSSGKADEEKVTARMDRGRGLNIQQVPRDVFIRGMFGAADGYSFIEADFSQIELRIVAFLSRDRRMLSLYQQGQDIHMATASWVMGKPPSQISKEDRKKAKAINFGFVYGMGAPKFVKTALEKYDLVFSLDEAKAIRKAFFDQFPGLLPWHARQRRLVQLHHRVQSPIGRIRHLPDIESEDQGVRAEAERQAINSPVQGFGSDLTMLSMNLISDHFERKGLSDRIHTIGTVHDAILFEAEHGLEGRAMRFIKHTMENLPLEKKFGVYMDVPIVADIKMGKYWGDAQELSEEEVMAWQ